MILEAIHAHGYCDVERRLNLIKFYIIKELYAIKKGPPWNVKNKKGAFMDSPSYASFYKLKSTVYTYEGSKRQFFFLPKNSAVKLNKAAFIGSQSDMKITSSFDFYSKVAVQKE